MANAADRLFERVLSQLPDPPEPPDPPRTPAVDDSGADGDDQIDSPPESEDGELEPYESIVVRDRVFDRMAGTLTVPEPSTTEKELVEGGIRVRGIDAIAFYKSRRFIEKAPFRGKWGIFYIREGLMHVAWEISKAYPGYRDPRTLAYDFIRSHEIFHFRADLRTLMFEATLGRHLYIPTRYNFRGKRNAFVEEAIANSQAYDWARDRKVGLQEFAHEFMMLQPGAYARFLEPIDDLTGEWAANVVDGLGPRCSPRYELAPWVLDTPQLFMRRSLCPEYVVFPKLLTNWIDPVCVVPPVTKISDGDKVIKVLERKRPELRNPWENTKRKMIQNRLINGLNFKPWPRDGKGAYSVKVNEADRAHLMNQGNGNWLAYEIGSHKELGHG
jgi:hypothetical protein